MYPERVSKLIIKEFLIKIPNFYQDITNHSFKLLSPQTGPIRFVDITLDSASIMFLRLKLVSI